MTLEHHLLEAARKDHLANILCGLATEIDRQQLAICFHMEPADRLTLREYGQNYPLKYISPELVQSVRFRVVAGVAQQHRNPAGRHEDKQPLRLHGRTGAGAQDRRSRLFAASRCVGVESASYIQQCIT